MGCEVIRMPGGGAGFLCGRGRTRKPKCKTCKTRPATLQCDHPTFRACRSCKKDRQLAVENAVRDGAPGPAKVYCHDCDSTGEGTCSAPICAGCSMRTPDGKDICPQHRASHQPKAPDAPQGNVAPTSAPPAAPPPPPPLADRRPCKLCGRALVFARSADTGASIPLDAGSITYTLEEHDGQTVAVRSRAMVTHFQTCPHAGAFSRREKK